ncbi:Tyrosine-protein kinase YwqD [Anaerococcus prevotii]|uniref:non-specific protein-tyrosine kinase n=1 Tax=Anaerococcus prevotii (strain ATCC 9321 / DSM 20548 / JCM 6508 / NCTC 11806 / PC1) TaxID=525919 RepID=C7RGH6_ANAPD|nr:CpsD/CapB family tyrosine-protein kinase [Anaerococcus prevotii]ACV28587.1 capsular exopolysaccharide family [Anaerococcus prevotii DSM 20548]SUU94146.1 Tyrosine-protein kinase YwqD [Anaerococcus prevotii]
MTSRNNYYSASMYDEAIRSVRTNIQFSSLDKKNKVISITSTKPAEGKSTVIYKLAKSFADNGDKVILLDCDLRSPSISEIAGINDNVGITNYLTGKVNIQRAINKDREQSNLDMIFTGPVPPNPAEILASNAFKDFVEDLSKQYDYVFIDTPPVGLFTDASLVSTISDGVIFVIKSSDTKKEDISLAIENLKKVDAHILGAVLTHMPMKEKKYGNYY